MLNNMNITLANGLFIRDLFYEYVKKRIYKYISRKI